MRPNDHKGLILSRLKEVLEYNPRTGIFKWKLTRNNFALKGNKAGSLTKKGYTQIRIDGNMFMAHRLAWLYMTGEWPKDFIDHINGIKDDNRFCNLREATKQENIRNSPPKKTSFSKYKGLFYNKITKKWVVDITIGSYDTEEEAALSYNKAALIHFGEFAFLNKVPEEKITEELKKKYLS